MSESMRTEGPLSGRTEHSGLLRGLLLLVVLIVLAVAFLYAYRAQPPAGERVSFAQVLTEVQDGQVRAVTIDGGGATVTLSDGRTQRATAPTDGQLTRAVLDHNQADPAHRIDLRSQQSSPGSSIGLSVVMGFLPLLILVALIVLAAAAFRRPTTSHRYESLTRLADLGDRAAISEDEFQREKRRLLR